MMEYNKVQATAEAMQRHGGGFVKALGDALMLPAVCTDMSTPRIASTFGRGFRDAVLSLPVGRWEGPVESGFGLHLVKITRREESEIPELSKVLRRVVADMQYEGRKAAEDQFYAEVLPRYRVVYGEGVTAALEGNAGAEGRGTRGP